LYAVPGGDEKPSGGAEKVEGAMRIFDFRFWIFDFAAIRRDVEGAVIRKVF
jgi:hypothetical protein